MAALLCGGVSGIAELRQTGVTRIGRISPFDSSSSLPQFVVGLASFLCGGACDYDMSQTEPVIIDDDDEKSIVLSGKSELCPGKEPKQPGEKVKKIIRCPYSFMIFLMGVFFGGKL